MTTNHPEVLIESLIRPGRIDRKFKFTECNHDMIRKLYFNFFKLIPFGKIIVFFL